MGIVSNFKKTLEDKNIYTRIVKELKKDIDSKPHYLIEELNLNDEETEYTEEMYKKSPNKLIKKWISIRFLEFMECLKNADFTGNNIHLYRKVGIKDIDKFLKLVKKGKFVDNYEGIGVCWTYQEDIVGVWGFNHDEGDPYILSATVDINDINYEETLIKELEPCLGICEFEIEIKKGKPVNIYQIEGGK